MMPFLILWFTLGIWTVFFTATTMGYLRWSDLCLIPFGPFWFVTSYWNDPDGKRLWERKQ